MGMIKTMNVLRNAMFCLMALALSASCLSAPPQEAPSSGAECHRAHQYSLDRHRDISDQYQRTNLLLGATGAVLWFGFVEALAIPVVGMPLSYYQYEQLAKRNLDSLESSCGPGTSR
ncbi:MAG: hypothetical protein KDK23_14845 [Leptospiraceae bacterium]|nr:hypothetical protein [Leptospiraceae bacterium]